MLLGRHDELFVGGFGEKSIGKVEKQGGPMLLEEINAERGKIKAEKA